MKSGPHIQENMAFNLKEFFKVQIIPISILFVDLILEKKKVF